MLRYTKRIFELFRRPIFYYLTTLSLTLIGLCSIAFYQIEFGSNPKIQNYFDALYFSVTVMTTVGLGDISPVTTLGKVLTILMMLIGTFIFVSFIGIFTGIITEIEIEEYESRHGRKPVKAEKNSTE